MASQIEIRCSPEQRSVKYRSLPQTTPQIQHFSAESTPPVEVDPRHHQVTAPLASRRYDYLHRRIRKWRVRTGAGHPKSYRRRWHGAASFIQSARRQFLLGRTLVVWMCRHRLARRHLSGYGTARGSAAPSQRFSEIALETWRS
jgi:hypothetical protein